MSSIKADLASPPFSMPLLPASQKIFKAAHKKCSLIQDSLHSGQGKFKLYLKCGNIVLQSEANNVQVLYQVDLTGTFVGSLYNLSEVVVTRGSLLPNFQGRHTLQYFKHE